MNIGKKCMLLALLPIVMLCYQADGKTTFYGDITIVSEKPVLTIYHQGRQLTSFSGVSDYMYSEQSGVLYILSNKGLQLFYDLRDNAKKLFQVQKLSSVRQFYFSADKKVCAILDNNCILDLIVRDRGGYKGCLILTGIHSFYFSENGSYLCVRPFAKTIPLVVYKVNKDSVGFDFVKKHAEFQQIVKSFIKDSRYFVVLDNKKTLYSYDLQNFSTATPTATNKNSLFSLDNVSKYGPDESMLVVKTQGWCYYVDFERKLIVTEDKDIPLTRPTISSDCKYMAGCAQNCCFICELQKTTNTHPFFDACLRVVKRVLVNFPAFDSSKGDYQFSFKNENKELHIHNKGRDLTTIVDVVKKEPILTSFSDFFDTYDLQEENGTLDLCKGNEKKVTINVKRLAQLATILKQKTGKKRSRRALIQSSGGVDSSDNKKASKKRKLNLTDQ